MAKRHRDALFIWEGACNPSGMAHSLVAACKECLDAGVIQREDPAIRIMVAQLAYICGVWDGVSAWPTPTSTTDATWDASEACRAEVRKDDAAKQ